MEEEGECTESDEEQGVATCQNFFCLCEKASAHLLFPMATQFAPTARVALASEQFHWTVVIPVLLPATAWHPRSGPSRERGTERADRVAQRGRT